MSKFIKKDNFGILSSLRRLYRYKKEMRWLDRDKGYNFRFLVWVNQFLPPTFYESIGTIQRHIDEIYAITYKPEWVWIKRNNQYGCAIINDSLLQQLDKKEVELPLYLEIENEKKRWQANENYDKKEGFSNPIKEELIQLVLKRR